MAVSEGACYQSYPNKCKSTSILLQGKNFEESSFVPYWENGTFLADDLIKNR